MGTQTKHKIEFTSVESGGSWLVGSLTHLIRKEREGDQTVLRCISIRRNGYSCY
jgi:hypothetical protein